MPRAAPLADQERGRALHSAAVSALAYDSCGIRFFTPNQLLRLLPPGKLFFIPARNLQRVPSSGSELRLPRGFSPSNSRSGTGKKVQWILPSVFSACHRLGQLYPLALSLTSSLVRESRVTAASFNLTLNLNSCSCFIICPSQ